MTIFDRLRKFDAYPKTLEEYRDKTIGGAAGLTLYLNLICFLNVCIQRHWLFMLIISVTVTSAVLMVLLLLTELNNYLQPTISEDLYVDTTRSHKLNINLDLTIPRISCNCKDNIWLWLRVYHTLAMAHFGIRFLIAYEFNPEVRGPSVPTHERF